LVEFRLERSSSTFSAFCLVTGRAFGTAEGDFPMAKRVLVLIALALAVGTCKTSVAAAPAIAGIGDVRVLEARLVPSADTGPGLAASGVTYVLATVALTNGTTRDMTPAIERFFLTASRNERYAGTDSGSSVFVGVSNPHTMLKHGATRTYTVGFRTTDPVVSGTISYEP
jgi:hypothetical protein